MAIRYITGTSTSGNWTAATIAGTFMWNNYPTLGIPGIDSNAGTIDDVYSNAKTIFISNDINIGIGTLRNTASTPIVAGGIFSITGNNVSITANTAGGATTTLTTTGVTSTSTINYYGNITGGSTTSAYGFYVNTGVTVNFNNPTTIIQTLQVNTTVSLAAILNLGNINIPYTASTTCGASGSAGLLMHAIHNNNTGSTLYINTLVTNQAAGAGSYHIFNSGTTIITAHTKSSQSYDGIITNYGNFTGYNMDFNGTPVTVASTTNFLNYGISYVTGITNTTTNKNSTDNYGTLYFSGGCGIAGNLTGFGLVNRETGNLNFIGSISGGGTTSSNIYYALTDYSNISGTGTTITLDNVFYDGCYIKTGSTNSFIFGSLTPQLNQRTSSTLTPVIVNNSTSGILTISGTSFSGASSAATPTILSGNSQVNQLIKNINNGTTYVYGNIFLRDVTTQSASGVMGGLISNSGGGNLYVYGSLYGGSNASTISSCVANLGAGNVYISGDTIIGGSINGSGYLTSTFGSNGVYNTLNGNIFITANTIGSGNGSYSMGVVNFGTGNLTITSNTFNMGSGINSHIAYNNTTGIITINSPTNSVNTRSTNAYNASTTLGFGAFLYNAGNTTGTINFVGNNILSSFGSNTALYNGGSGRINVTGNTILGSSGNTSTIHNQGTGTINISGVTLMSGGTGTAAYLIRNVSSGVINIIPSNGVNEMYVGNGPRSHTIYNENDGTININNNGVLNIYGGSPSVSATPPTGGDASSVIINDGLAPGLGSIIITGSGTTNIICRNTITGDDNSSNIEPRGQAVGAYQGTITITGGTVNITGGTGSSNNCILARLSTICAINISTLNNLVANPTGTGSTCYAITNRSYGYINITGDSASIYCGVGTSNHGIHNSNTGTVTTIGISYINLGSGATSYGVTNLGTGSISMRGLKTISGNTGSGNMLIESEAGSINIDNPTNNILNLYGGKPISGTAANVIGVYNGTLNITGGGETNILSNNTLAGDYTNTYGHSIGCHNGTINITGGTINITGGTGSFNTCIMSRLNNPAVINLTGLKRVVVNPSGSSTDCYGIFNNGISNTTISGTDLDIYGGNGPNNHLIYKAPNSTTNNITISGIRNLFIGTGTTTYGVYNNSSAGFISISARAFNSGQNYQQYGVYNNTTGRIDISATTISASNLFNTYTVYSTTNGTLNITADTISSSNVSPAIYSVGTTSTNNIVFGNLVFNNGISPVYTYPYASSRLTSNLSQDSIIVMEDTNNNYVEFATSGFTGNNSAILPSSGNVRNNLVYGYSAATVSLTGSSIIPPASAVTFGTLYDSGTTGTAPAISVYDFGNALITTGQTV